MARTNRAAFGALGLHAMAEYAQWVAILVWAFEAGGASRAAAVAVVSLAVSAVSAPLISAGVEHLDPVTAYRLGAGVQTVLVASLTALLALEVPGLVIIGVSALCSAAFTSTRPAHYGLLPNLLDRPQHLIAAARTSRTAEMFGGSAGPFLTAFALALAGIPEAMAFATLVIACSFVSTLCLTRAAHPRETQSAAAIIGERTSLVRLIRHQPGAIGVLLIGATHFAVIGALDLLTVALAVSGNGNQSFAGVLTGCFGLGALLAVAVVRNRLPSLVFRGMLVGAAGFLALLVATALLPRPAFIVSFFVAGAALASVDTGNRTMLPRAMPSSMLGRVYGLQETAMMIGLATGALGGPVVLELFGLTSAFVAVGALLPIVIFAQTKSLRLLDRLGIERSAALALAANSTLFGEAPPNVVSAIAFAMEKVRFEADAVIIRQGDAGECMYFLSEGSADVFVHGQFVRTLMAGAHVGEVALLRQSGRTATVVATSDVTMWRLGSEPFLIAVTTVPGDSVVLAAAGGGHYTDLRP